jgi:hypothetical protein
MPYQEFSGLRGGSTPFIATSLHGLVRGVQAFPRLRRFIAPLVQFPYPKGGELFVQGSASAPAAAPALNSRSYFSNVPADPRAAARLYQLDGEVPILTVRFISQSVAACLLSACVAEPVQPVWVKDGASQSDFDKDRRACTLALNQRPLGVTNQNLYDTCMSARGWNQTAQAATKPPRYSPSAF